MHKVNRVLICSVPDSTDLATIKQNIREKLIHRPQTSNHPGKTEIDTIKHNLRSKFTITDGHDTTHPV